MKALNLWPGWGWAWMSHNAGEEEWIDSWSNFKKIERPLATNEPRQIERNRALIVAYLENV